MFVRQRSNKWLAVVLCLSCGASLFADYRNYHDDFRTSLPMSTGWEYYWNAPDGWVPDESSGDMSTIGTYSASGFVPLLDAGDTWTPDGDSNNNNNAPARYLELTVTGGHPGAGSNIVSNTKNRYAIVAYTAQHDGYAQVVDSFVVKGALHDGLHMQLRVNDEYPVVWSRVVDPDERVSFNKDLGYLNAGDDVYVLYGPHGTDYGDTFWSDFTILQEAQHLSLGVCQMNLATEGTLAEEKEIIDEVVAAWAKRVRLSARQDSFSDTVEHVKYAAQSGLQSLVLLETRNSDFYEDGAPLVSGANSSTYRMSDLDLFKFEAEVRDLFQLFVNAETAPDAIEVFNEVNWKFNGDFLEQQEVAFNYGTSWTNANYVRIRSGIEKIGQAFKIVDELVDEYFGTNAVQVISAGLISPHSELWVPYEDSGMIAPLMYDLLQGTHPDQIDAEDYLQYVDGVGIHLYPWDVDADPDTAYATQYKWLKQRIDAYLNVVSGKEFWVTEWGYAKSMFSGSDIERQRYDQFGVFLDVMSSFSEIDWGWCMLFDFARNPDFAVYDGGLLESGLIFNAGLILEERFDTYPGGSSLNGVTNNTSYYIGAWSDDGEQWVVTNDTVEITGNLTAERSLANPVSVSGGAPTHSAIYAAVDMKRVYDGTSGGLFVDFANSQGESLFCVQINELNAQVKNTASWGLGATAVDSDTFVKLVMKWEDDQGRSKLTFWVDPSVETDTPAVVSVRDYAGSDVSLGAISMQAWGTSLAEKGTVREILVGGTFDSVATY